ncbi:MAG: GGDEF domain-containing protein [Bacteroidetes bacterium]|nr:GGDEF domain-containing protein [Bacteroidota bacterium]
MDLDYFKYVNDNHGHAYGDLVLKEFSKLLLKVHRDSNITAQYGVEEFVILLSGATWNEYKVVAEEMRCSAESQIYNDGSTELLVTVSVGVSSLQKHVSIVDEALYKAKKNSRNRVELFGE